MREASVAQYFPQREGPPLPTCSQSRMKAGLSYGRILRLGIAQKSPIESTDDLEDKIPGQARTICSSEAVLALCLCDLWKLPYLIFSDCKKYRCAALCRCERGATLQSHQCKRAFVVMQVSHLSKSTLPLSPMRQLPSSRIYSRLRYKPVSLLPYIRSYGVTSKRVESSGRDKAHPLS